MAKSIKKQLTSKESEELLTTLKKRFDKHMTRHRELDWSAIQSRLEANPEKLWSLQQMEETGGEPDVITFDKQSGKFQFVDCSAESPSGRRSICFDREAWESRKEHKPSDSAEEMATAMGIELLSEDEYKALQNVGKFDSKTSSWIRTPAKIRKLGGALFSDYRYDTVFVYHNGAQSYYAARGFRGSLWV